MKTLEELELEIEKIKFRNKKVEADKAWKTSFFRRALIFLLTYFVVVLFFTVAQLPKPFVNSIVPSFGFLLSTLTIPIFKRIWLKYYYLKNINNKKEKNNEDK
ncbi:MAG TPA: hypothetical protein PKL09_00700 [bacterium]|nr:hypothetical protein [bacterium]HNS33735.1 hypothetical protein [bacterium]